VPAGFGARGEGYVVLQSLLLLVVAVGPRGPALGDWAGHPATRLLAVVLVAAGAALALAGLLRLGRNLTPLPYPRESGVLVERGIYALVRHPIYGGLMLLALGGALGRNGVVPLAVAALLAVVLAAKSRREESWLESKHPGYAAYRSRTRRFLPFLW
jgi:protein-S-isoprenylcysteine O-methyltransferase Ste14